MLFSLLFTGCRTKGTMGARLLDLESMSIVSSSPALTLPRTCLSGNLKLTVDINGSPLSAKGFMRVKEDCGVQIGMTALGLMEIACLEFLPENMRLIYKLGKEYADVPYADVPFLQNTGVDYKLLESVLMNRLFSPDGRPFVKAMNEMSYADDDSCVVVSTEETNGVVYKFYIDKLTNELVQSEGEHVDGGKVVCRYSDFKTVDGVSFPHTISLNLEGIGSAVTLQFALSRLELGSIAFAPRQLSSSYDKMDIEQLLKSLGNK